MANSLSLARIAIANRISLNEVHFDAGQLNIIVGQNGAGKSSLLQVCAGLLSSDADSVHWQGHAINSLPQWSATRGIYSHNAVPEFTVTVAQMLRFYDCPETLPDELEAVLHIAVLANKPLARCSVGEQVRAHLARVLLSVWPALQQGQGVLLLDEPFNGLDVQFQARVLTLLSALAQQNVVLVAMHDVAMIRYLRDAQLCLIQHQQVLGTGKSAALFTDPSSMLWACLGNVTVAVSLATSYRLLTDALAHLHPL
jgi:vitamin B12 transport system ATP-binding protein